MKEEIIAIINKLECNENSSRLRAWAYNLSASRPDDLQSAINCLLDALQQTNIQSHSQKGFYYLFLGCAYYEQGDHPNSRDCLLQAINKLSDTEVNNPVAHWLLGVNYSKMKDFPSARRELENALQLLKTNTSLSTPRTEAKSRKKKELKLDIQETLEKFSNEPLFRVVDSPSAKNNGASKKESPTGDTENVESKTSQENSSARSSPTTQEKEKIIYQETHTGRNVSFQFIQTITPASIPSFQNTSTGKSIESHLENNKTSPFEETRTDGYLSLQSLPVYEQMVAAGKSGKPEIGLNITGAAEARIIFLNNQPHDVHPLKRTSNEIKIASKEINWGWVKVAGHSMNNIANKTSIKNGDFVLILFVPAADENDIVLASFEDQQTTQSFLTVKRYRKDRQILKSETTEKGDEYNDIHLGDKNNAKIIGVIYAVAKPFDS
ncbi:S24 family peptidase [Candidatus Villigracilis saccharophilus]|uniref:S24 family peptidase n=1 Tax=Candidatus Villigracilis saccharophilus TaxID=3140684 RepID=UPI003134BB08|nr:hypothetical protein [Anaerolineales bacterium]